MIPNNEKLQPTIDYRTIAAMPISKRQAFVQQNPNIINLLTPGQIASLFPKAYEDWAGTSNFTTAKASETQVANVPDSQINAPTSDATVPDPIIPKLPQTATPIDNHQRNEQPVTLSGGNTNKAYQYFRSQGWTDAQAKGIIGSLMGESGQNLDQWANKSGEDAYGIAQWHKDRRDTFEKQFGKSIFDASLEEQLQFVNWELNHTEKTAGDNLRSAQKIEDATWAVTKDYERPADPEGDYKTRLDYAQKLTVEEAPEKTQTAELLPDKTDSQTDTNVQSDTTTSASANSTPASSLEYQKLLEDQINNSSQFGVSSSAQKQGLTQSLARMHPEYLRRAEAVQKQLKEAGLPAYLYSNYRPKEYGVNTHRGWSADKSMHGFGLASDWGGITGKNGRLLVTPEQYQKFTTIMEANGFYRPWKSDVERNHWQIVPDKTVDNPEITKIRDAWAKTGYADENLKHKLDVAINNYYKFGPEADSLVNPVPVNMDAKEIIQQAKGELNDVDKQAFETRPEVKQRVLQKFAENKGLVFDPKTETFSKQDVVQAAKAQETATVEPAKSTTSAQQVASLDSKPIPTATADKVGPLPVRAFSINPNGSAVNPADEPNNLNTNPTPRVQKDVHAPESVNASKMTTSSVKSDFVPIVNPGSNTPKSLIKAYDRSDFGGTKGLGQHQGV